MKKFKRLFLSLCVICLTLFNFSTPTKAATFTGNTYSVMVLDTTWSVIAARWNVTSWASGGVVVTGSTGSYPILGVGRNIYEVNLTEGTKYINFTCDVNTSLITRYNLSLVGSDGTTYTEVECDWSRTGGTVSASCSYDVPVTDTYTVVIREIWSNRTITGSFNIVGTMLSLDIGSDPVAGGINDVQSGISNIQSSISTINSDIVAINSNITGVNNTLASFERNVEEDMTELRTSISNGSSDIVDSIGTLESSFLESISFVNQGIADAWKTSQSIEQLVQQLVNKLETTNTYIETWFGELFGWFQLLYDWQDLIVQSLVNVQSQSVTNTNDLINALGAHDSALALNLSNLGNSLLSGMNTLNTDIQNQMITQTSNITNNIVAQTNALNSSIKTMENAVTTKLDETLVVKDKEEIDSNDSSTEDLEGAITDYDNVEKDLVTDFNESLDAIDTDSASSIYSQNDFIKTAQFISTNMQNVYESNDFVGGMIDVILLLGLIFTVIGIGVR